jgi:hypothetical protein
MVTGVPPTPDHSPQATAAPRRFAKLRSANGARIILGTMLALLLLTTWTANNPALHSGSSPSDWRDDLLEAGVSNEMNAGETKGAAQQAVVNGWYANDIAVVQAAQNTYIAGSSMRNGNLLALIGLGVAGELIIRGVERTNRQRPVMS